MTLTWTDKIGQTKRTIADIQSGDAQSFHTGFVTIDSVLYGSVLPGAQIIIGGATGMGKTMTMLCLALSLAKEGKKIAYFSLENSVHSLIVRLSSNLSGVPVELIRRGELSCTEEKKLETAYERLGKLRIEIYDDIFDPAKICKNIEEEKPDVFFVDYIQILYLSGISQNRTRTQEIGKISKIFRQVAKLNNAISVLGAQLNRNVSWRDNKRSTLAEFTGFRGAGAGCRYSNFIVPGRVLLPHNYEQA